LKERLVIKNFGPIESVKLELGTVNVLIGDQSTGKSTVAKVLSVIKNVVRSSNIDLTVNGKTGTYEQKMKWFDNEFHKDLEDFGIINYLKTDSYIEFNSSKNFFKYENQKILANVTDNEKRDKDSFVISYIPAYRESSNLLSFSLAAIAHAKAYLPPLFYSFTQELTNAKLAQPLHDYTDILNVQYKHINGNERIVMSNGKEITFEEASSAINSLIPLLLVFDKAVESNHPTRHRVSHHLNCPYIIIEEPELNCFPTTQKKLMDHFISKIKYQTNEGFDYYNNLIITTHSPYILTSLNNLIYAYKIGQIHNEEADKIIEKKYWVNPGDVSVYMMLANGECEDIFDGEEGLIKAEKIDGVTNTLNEQFSSLLNLQFAPNEFNT